MNLVIKHASSLLLSVLKWNLVDVPCDDHGKEKENTQLFFFFFFFFYQLYGRVDYREHLF